DGRRGARLRPALPRARPADQQGRGGARIERLPPRPQRSRPPARARAGSGPAARPGRGGARAGRVEPRRGQAGDDRLPRDPPAAARLGDPERLIRDEPANGLDPAGVRWLRTFLQTLAAQGRTVLVSSHLLAEVAQTVDQVLIIDHGHLLASGRLDELTQNGKT